MSTLFALVFLIIGAVAVVIWLLLIAERSSAASVVAAFALGFFALATAAAWQAAKAHDKMGHWLDAWGVKCCSDLHKECRPVRSMYDEARGLYVVWIDGQPRDVPETAVLTTVESPDGSSYACLDQYDGRIRCFVNGKPRS